MYIGVFRLILIILSSMVAGMNVFNILSAKANGQSIQIPLLTCLAMVAIVLMMVATQYFQNRRTNKD